MMSTGSISLPLILQMSPKCFTSGILFVVTLMGNGSISEQLIGLIPTSFAPKQNPPLPSNRLHKVRGLPFLFFIYFHLFYQILIFHFLISTKHKHTLCITGIFYISS